MCLTFIAIDAGQNLSPLQMYWNACFIDEAIRAVVRCAMYKPLMLAVLMLMPMSLAAWAASPCPFPMVQECRPMPQLRPPATEQCRCVYAPGSPTWGGKAEIHKKNVPTVKPNRGPGSNN